MKHRRSPHVVLLVGALSVVAFLTSAPESAPQIAAWLVPSLLAATLLTWRVVTEPVLRRPLGVLLAGYLLYVVALLIWYLGPVVLDRQVPFPSLLDGLFFVAYGTYAVFLVMLLRRAAPDQPVARRIALCDSLILTVSLSAVLWVSVLEPNLHAGLPLLTTAATLLYPALVLLLFALTARLALSTGRLRSVPSLLLLLHMGGGLADMFYAFQSANGTFSYGSPLMVAYMVAYTALAALAVHPGLRGMVLEREAGAREAGDPASGRARLRLVLLLLAALVPLGLATVSPGSLVPLVATAAGTFALVTYRAYLVAGDLGEQRRLSARLGEAVEELASQRDRLVQLATAVESSDDSMVTTDLAGVITLWNPGATSLYGWTSEQMVGRHVSRIVTPGAFRDVLAVLDGVAPGRPARLESVGLRSDGTQVPTSVTVSAIVDTGGQPVGFVTVARDVSDRKRSEEQARDAARRLEQQAAELTRLAYADLLTGLGNRNSFHRRLEEVAAEASVERPFALVMLDLDDFKVVNDSLGHAIGDALLVAAGDRLRQLAPDSATIARLGGDEFALLLPSSDEQAAVVLAQTVLAAFGCDFVVEGHAVRTAASVGIAVGVGDAGPTDLMRNADLAMYAAKAAGKGKLAPYRPELLVAAQQRLDLENHLRRALQRDEITLAYQPIVDATSGQLHGLEALLRWQHPTWGSVSPAAFIPVAEMSGTILPIGAWVLRTACRDAQEVAARRGHPVRMSVNVSVRQLHAHGFVEVVDAALRESGLDPHLLTLEITESLLMDDDQQSATVLHGLHELGVCLSIDDFGTGHSSLARLRTLPVSELKIDRAFIDDVAESPSIVTAIVAMARALGLSVVAEGVETAAQLEALQHLGCDAVQGFLIARPVPLAQLQLDGLGKGQPAQDPDVHRMVGLVDRLRTQPADDPGTAEARTDLVRAALSELVAATGLETAYVTRIDLERGMQEVLLSHSLDVDLVPEGLVVDWADTICKRATEVGPSYTTDVMSCFPDSRGARELGLKTYVGVPIRTADGTLVGTLCGASVTEHRLTPDMRTLIEILAHVIGPTLASTPRAAA